MGEAAYNTAQDYFLQIDLFEQALATLRPPSEYKSEEDDIPEKYPTEIKSELHHFVYRIYYRQE